MMCGAPADPEQAPCHELNLSVDRRDVLILARPGFDTLRADTSCWICRKPFISSANLAARHAAVPWVAGARAVGTTLAGALRKSSYRARAANVHRGRLRRGAVRYPHPRSSLQRSNALKYSPSGSEVRVGVRSVPGAAEIQVADSGQGIAPGELDLLFRKFSRTSAHSMHGEKSTGLGLYIVKMLVDLHGGSVRVDSQRGQGSTFTIMLPEPVADDTV